MLLKGKECKTDTCLSEFKNRIKFIEGIVSDKEFAKKLISTYNNNVYFNILDFILVKRPDIIKNMEKFKEEYNRMASISE